MSQGLKNTSKIQVNEIFVSPAIKVDKPSLQNDGANPYSLKISYKAYFKEKHQIDIKNFSILDKCQKYNFVILQIDQQEKILTTDLKIENLNYFLKNYKNYQIILTSKRSFDKIFKQFESQSNQFLLAKSINDLDFSHQKISCFNLPLIKICMISFILIYMIANFVNYDFIANFLIAIALLINLKKIILLILSIYFYKPAISNQQLNAYPSYTILIPLYNEPNELILRSMQYFSSKLNYPKHRYKVIYLVEEDDKKAIHFFKKTKLAQNINFKIITASKLKTKPKALNYVLPLINTDLVVVYDIEDRPDKNQLAEVVSKFNSLASDVICIQAKLHLLAKNKLLDYWFAAEYKLWFSYSLSGLKYFNSAVPLGGTSNHFKVKKLKEIGGWDAYNVTEDAELGLRIYHNNYRTEMIESFTYEDRLPNLYYWLRQRSRWIKGFSLTALNYLRFMKENPRLINLKTLIGVSFIIGSNVSFLVMPFLIKVSCYDEIIGLKKLLLQLNFICYLLYIYSFILLTGEYKIDAKINFKKLFSNLTFPLYFTLHMLVAYYSLIETIFYPFKWNKTNHKKIK